MVLQEKLLTADDLWELAHQPENAAKRFELVEGALREMSPTGGEHGEVAGIIFGLIWMHVRQHQLGRVTAAETGYVLRGSPYTVRAPAVGFISQARSPQPLAAQYVPLPPDLAVEVVSPGDRADAIEEKVLDYLQAGTAAVWIIYPPSQTVIVHTAAQVYRLGPDDTLDGGGVLPGFAVQVRALFPTAS